ncbi:ribonuclease G [Nitrosomonadaceae bacterium]|nr:ribonuclease G [Nitrosomonadaceae bacterium]
MKSTVSNEILVNITAQEIRVALMEGGVVQELHIEQANNPGVIGNIYNGRISRVLPGMQAAFIDIGLDCPAFLHVTDIFNPHQGDKIGRPIEKMLHEGENILVQVIKDSIGNKKARLSTQISIVGRMLVYLPQESSIAISQRIEDKIERELLREKLQRLIPAVEEGGYIIRTMARAASEASLLADVRYLHKLWLNIKKDFLSTFLPTLLYQDLNLSHRILRDFVNDDTVRILVDSQEIFQKMIIFTQEYMTDITKRVECYIGKPPLFDLYRVEDEVVKSLARQVNLKSGGYLVFDQTEALIVVDVNTGKFVGVYSFEDTILKTNLEAVFAIAHQLRLRNLGGIIVIDFIDMENKEHRSTVLVELRKALMRDRMRSTVHGFTKLGLVEMTRKRIQGNLASVVGP